MADYEPGRIAKATVRGVPDVTVMRTDGTGGADAIWLTAQFIGGTRRHFAADVTDVRPLVVLDLDAAPFDFDGHATPEKFLRAVAEHARWRGAPGDPPNVRFAEWIAEAIEGQTRPAIEEPKGLGAVVESADGVRWIRSDMDDRARAPWFNSADGGWRGWTHINAARVLSPGVEP